MVCVVILIGLVVVNVLGGLQYPPLLANAAAMLALVAYIARDLARESRVR
jgi:hypothetical protein